MQTPVARFNRLTKVEPFGVPATPEQAANEMAFVQGLTNKCFEITEKNERNKVPTSTISLEAARIDKAFKKGELAVQWEERTDPLARRYNEHPWTTSDVLIEEIKRRQWFWETYANRSVDSLTRYLGIARPWHFSPKFIDYIQEPPLNEEGLSWFEYEASRVNAVFLRTGWWQHPYMFGEMLHDDQADYKFVRLFDSPGHAVDTLKTKGIISADAEPTFVDQPYQGEYLQIPVQQINEFCIRRFPDLGGFPRFLQLQKPSILKV